jgi:hypothetical protein
MTVEASLDAVRARVRADLEEELKPLALPGHECRVVADAETLLDHRDERVGAPWIDISRAAKPYGA